MTVPFIRKSTQRNSSWPGDLIYLQSKAEYICADLSIGLRFPFAVARRTIRLGKRLKHPIAAEKLICEDLCRKIHIILAFQINGYLLLTWGRLAASFAANTSTTGVGRVK